MRFYLRANRSYAIPPHLNSGGGDKAMRAGLTGPAVDRMPPRAILAASGAWRRRAGTRDWPVRRSRARHRKRSTGRPAFEPGRPDHGRRVGGNPVREASSALRPASPGWSPPPPYAARGLSQPKRCWTWNGGFGAGCAMREERRSCP